MTNAELVAGWVEPGTVIGLGTGRAATQFLLALGKRVEAGLSIRGVPTSEQTARHAEELRIPLVGLDQLEQPLAMTVDGADEVDPESNLIKGWGGALVRERIVAASAERFVILIGPDGVNEKVVPKLGERGKLPIEIVPFSFPLCLRKLEDLGLSVVRRENQGRPFVSDNGNWILDARVEAMDNPRGWERRIREIPGVVDTGLFLGMATDIVIQRGESVEHRRRIVE